LSNPQPNSELFFVTESDAPHSTTKLVATNLIAEGKLWQGVQLLCLINKVQDS
jgi:hypothetical protein